MYDVYAFVSGPMVWIAFTVFVVGSIARVLMFLSLAKRMDPCFSRDMDPSMATSSILRWLFPVNITATTYPLVTVAGYVFHICLFVVAVFLSAHVILFEMSWGTGWPFLSDAVADVLTIAFLAAAAFFLGRRLVSPDLRALTSPIDWVVLTLAVLPFLTGFLAAWQVWEYRVMLIVHIICGNLMLMAIPFTKLSHMVLFFVSRAAAGCDFGKRKTGPW